MFELAYVENKDIQNFKKVYEKMKGKLKLFSTDPLADKIITLASQLTHQPETLDVTTHLIKTINKGAAKNKLLKNENEIELATYLHSYRQTDLNSNTSTALHFLCENLQINLVYAQELEKIKIVKAGYESSAIVEKTIETRKIKEFIETEKNMIKTLKAAEKLLQNDKKLPPNTRNNFLEKIKTLTDYNPFERLTTLPNNNLLAPLFVEEIGRMFISSVFKLRMQTMADYATLYKEQIKAINKKLGNNAVDLTVNLIAPVQHLPRYGLLFKALKQIAQDNLATRKAKNDTLINKLNTLEKTISIPLEEAKKNESPRSASTEIQTQLQQIEPNLPQHTFKEQIIVPLYALAAFKAILDKIKVFNISTNTTSKILKDCYDKASQQSANQAQHGECEKTLVKEFKTSTNHLKKSNCEVENINHVVGLLNLQLEQEQTSDTSIALKPFKDCIVNNLERQDNLTLSKNVIVHYKAMHRITKNCNDSIIALFIQEASKLPEWVKEIKVKNSKDAYISVLEKQTENNLALFLTWLENITKKSNTSNTSNTLDNNTRKHLSDTLRLLNAETRYTNEILDTFYADMVEQYDALQEKAIVYTKAANTSPEKNKSLNNNQQRISRPRKKFNTPNSRATVMFAGFGSPGDNKYAQKKFAEQLFALQQSTEAQSPNVARNSENLQSTKTSKILFDNSPRKASSLPQPLDPEEKIFSLNDLLSTNLNVTETEDEDLNITASNNNNNPQLPPSATLFQSLSDTEATMFGKTATPKKPPTSPTANTLTTPTPKKPPTSPTANTLTTPTPKKPPAPPTANTLTTPTPKSPPS